MPKSSKTAADPVVEDSNVIETIDVSTSGNAIYNTEESEESDNEDNQPVVRITRFESIIYIYFSMHSINQ